MTRVDAHSMADLLAAMDAARAQPEEPVTVLAFFDVPSEPRRLRVGDLVEAGEERPVGVPPGGGKPMPLADEMFVVRNVRPFERPKNLSIVLKAPRR